MGIDNLEPVKFFGKIYKIVNNINDKVYIGQTTRNIYKRFKQHCSTKDCPKISSAISKYGKEEFCIILIDSAHSMDELNRLEREYIAKYDSINNGYNIDFGGGAQTRSIETKVKISRAATGKKWDADRSLRASKQRKGRPAKNYNRSEASRQRRRNGNPLRKKIIDHLGRIYDSINDASRKTGIPVTAISKVVNGEISQTRGFIFSFDLTNIPSPSLKNAIVDHNGKVYKSISAAAKDLQLDASSISKVLKGKIRHTKGYRFKLYEQ